MTPQDYCKREPEKLVLQGYRLWSMGIVTQEYTHWEDAWNLFAGTLGADDGRFVMDAMVRFVRTLGRCAACPLRTHAPESAWLCQDEILVLGLIAGIQHGDDKAVQFCLNALSCSSRCSDVELAAGEFALTLRSLDKRLLPISLEVLGNTLGQIASEDRSNATLH
ncbi:MAG: hypothetical protein ABJN26_08335 [Stappiaceae bacterium]